MGMTRRGCEPVQRSSAALNEPATAVAGRASKTAISPIWAAGKSSVTKSRASPIKLTDEMIAARMEL